MPGHENTNWNQELQQRKRAAAPNKQIMMSEDRRFCKSVYSSSRLVTLCLSPMEFPTGDEFQRSEVGERLVGSHAVIDVFPMAQLIIEPQWLIRVRVHLVKLFMVGAMGALDVGVQFGRLRREHEQGQLFLLAGQLEFGGELAAAVDL